jgi:hypothetical protein
LVVGAGLVGGGKSREESIRVSVSLCAQPSSAVDGTSNRPASRANRGFRARTAFLLNTVEDPGVEAVAQIADDDERVGAL